MQWSLDDLIRKQKEIQDRYINITSGFGGGAIGSTATFSLEVPISGQASVQAVCLTPCPPGKTTLLKDSSGQWYALSPNAGTVQHIAVTQNRRYSQPNNPQPVRIAMVIRETNEEKIVYWVIVEGRQAVRIIDQPRFQPSAALTALRNPWLSATSSGTIYFDTYNYDPDNSSRKNYHFRIQGSRVEALATSPSWRSSFVNAELPFNSGIANPPADPNACLNFYRSTRTVNIADGKLWDYPLIQSPPEFPQLLAGGSTLGDEDFAYLQTHAVRAKVEIRDAIAQGGSCTLGNAEVREFEIPRIRWEIPGGSIAGVVSLIAY